MLNRAITEFSQINAVYASVRFTMELKTNGCMPFVDVLVERCESGIVIRTYPQHTHTGLYSNWSSFVPWHYKRNFVNSLSKRAYAITSSYKSKHEDFQPIKTMLVCNGFPSHFLDDCVRNFCTEYTH